MIKTVLILLLVLLIGCGPADSGTRHEGPHARVGNWDVIWWQNANATSRKFLIETTRLHNTLLLRHLNGEPVPRVSITYYQTQSGLMTARNVMANRYNGQPLTTGSTAQMGPGIGFLNPWTRDIHIWAGAKLEAGQLGHLMMHVVLADDSHLDFRLWLQPRSRFNFEDWNLSVLIAGRR